ncbi:MAG: hypothetical protein M1115_01595 [Actinobacteria bacterium]|nr:hypothetical protein [Actinomycetota bacterium]
MGLLDTLLGRTKPVKADLDALFSLPAAAITLETAADIHASGQAGVCVKPAANASFKEAQDQIRDLLRTGISSEDSPGAAPLLGQEGDRVATGGTQATGGSSVATPGGPAASLPDLEIADDGYGYRWLVFSAGELDDLVSTVHMANTTLVEGGWGPQLLCSVFGFKTTSGSHSSASAADSYLVYLFKRGTFYPFVPTGKQRRDTEAELRLKSLLSGDLPLEQDLSRWFPLWELPVH